jgi:hypothetical protein
VRDWDTLVARAKKVPGSYIHAFSDERATLVARINQRSMQVIRYNDGRLHAVPINSYMPSDGGARRCDISVAWIQKE